MTELLSRLATWKLIIPFLIIFAAMSFYIFPRYQSQMSAAAGAYVTPLDVRVSYSAADVNALFQKLGTDGRAIYRTVVGKVDMLYPVVYGVLFMALLAYLLTRVSGARKKLILLALLPLGGVLFDYLENFRILAFLSQYPDIDEPQVVLAQQFTRLKHIMLYLSLALVSLLVVVLIFKKMLSTRTKT